MTTSTLDVGAPERDIAFDMARLALVVAPVFLIVSTIFWGFGGLASSALAFAIVVANLVLGALIIDRAAAVSPNLLMGAVLGGFVLRLIVLSVIVLPMRNVDWFEALPFGITLVGGHLGLLAWETQRIAGSLAYPGLPPSNRTAVTKARTRSQPE